MRWRFGKVEFLKGIGHAVLRCSAVCAEAAYKNEMLPTSVPEIQRTNLSMTVG
jgi:hypothetical protein